MTRKEKLRELIRESAVKLSAGNPSVEIEGSGLKLTLKIERYPSMDWMLRQSKTKFYEWAFLTLEDSEGWQVAGEGTKGYEIGVLADKERLRFELVGLADRIVAGNPIREELGQLIGWRERSVKIRLRELERAADTIPGTRKELARAQVTCGWLAEIEKELLEGLKGELKAEMAGDDEEAGEPAL